MAPDEVSQLLRQLPSEAMRLYGLPLSIVEPMLRQGRHESWSAKQWADAADQAVERFTQGQAGNDDGASGRPTQTHDEKPTGNTVKPRKPNPKETTPMIPKPSQTAQRTPSTSRAPRLAVANPPQAPKPASGPEAEHSSPACLRTTHRQARPAPAAPATSMPLPDGRLLTPAEAAAFLAIGKRKLWTLTNCRELPHVRIGRNVRYDLADLRKWIEQRKVSVRRKN